MPPEVPRTIEEALARARVLDGAYTSADLHASRAYITEQLTALRRMRLPGVRSPFPACPGEAFHPLPLHDRAARELRALCQSVIHDGAAVDHLSDFEGTRDPGGALAFACLLVLADKEEGAQFWLQYAAGGGNTTSALCLYLLHLRRGEMRDARHWARQITMLRRIMELDIEPGHYTPVAAEILDTVTETPEVGGTVHLALPEDGAAVPEEAVRNAVEDLDVDQIDGIGPIPQPSPELPHQLEDLVAPGP
jgi:hypothetical protein